MAQISTTILDKVEIGTVQQSGRMCRVVLLNDETTPMDAVVLVLLIVFNKDMDTANSLMLSAHVNGRAVIDVMPKKLAYAKRTEAMKLAKSLGCDEFTVVVEEEV